MKHKDLTSPQKKKLYLVFLSFLAIGLIVLIYCTIDIHTEKQRALGEWERYLLPTPEETALESQLGKAATKVSVGTYVENVRALNLKESSFRVEFLAWFRWQGEAELDMAHHFRVYKGLMNSQHLVKERHEGNDHYQLVRCDVTVSKNFSTVRFPLESHEIRFYIESELPMQQVVFVADTEGSGMNRNLALSGFTFLRNGIGVKSFAYDSNHGDPGISERQVSSELVTAVEMNRSDFGLYVKCFIALFGTLTWALIALYICTYHHVDPLGMLPGMLFGTVGNVMVGANLVPDSFEIGLLEYINFTGVLIILAITIAIININRIRTHDQDREFAHFFGRCMFFTVLGFTVAAQVILPVTAYMF